MASSDNLTSIQPWTFRQPFTTDSWISEAFSRDNETLTKALQKSISPHDAELPISPFFKPPSPPTPTVLNHQIQNLTGSASDPETKRRNAIPLISANKTTKRKSRASKRTTTTFITADPANFRQMVQQVTGVRLGGNAEFPVAPLLKPEPQRPPVHHRMQAGCLPTLDTSAFLLDHQQQQVVVGSTSMEMATAAVQPTLTMPPPDLVADGGACVCVDFDSLSSFPTLESWKVM